MSLWGIAEGPASLALPRGGHSGGLRPHPQKAVMGAGSSLPSSLLGQFPGSTWLSSHNPRSAAHSSLKLHSLTQLTLESGQPRTKALPGLMGERKVNRYVLFRR